MADVTDKDTTAGTAEQFVADLCARARAVATNSYSPYSRYRVGAAIYAAGQVFVGTNVENVSYPATVCAERVAMGAAVSAGHGNAMMAMALYAEADDEQFAGTVPLPCGICLQWLAELAPEIEIIICRADGPARLRVSDLLVMPFKRAD